MRLLVAWALVAIYCQSNLIFANQPIDLIADHTRSQSNVNELPTVKPTIPPSPTTPSRQETDRQPHL